MATQQLTCVCFYLDHSVTLFLCLLTIGSWYLTYVMTLCHRLKKCCCLSTFHQKRRTHFEKSGKVPNKSYIYCFSKLVESHIDMFLLWSLSLVILNPLYHSLSRSYSTRYIHCQGHTQQGIFIVKAILQGMFIVKAILQGIFIVKAILQCIFIVKVILQGIFIVKAIMEG